MSTPVFRITADGQDVTARIADRLASLSVIDASGNEADTCELTIDDRDGLVAVPPHQSTLQIALGTREKGLVDLGSYRVDRTELAGPPQLMTIGATAADMAGAIRAPRTISWEGQTLGSVVKSMAARSALEPLVDEGLAAIQLPFIAQTAESDMHLLTRLAREYDFTFAPKAGRLEFRIGRSRRL